MDANASNFESENYGAVVYYNQLLPYEFHTTIQAGYSYGDNEVRRYYEGRHKGDFASHTFSANIEVGKVFFVADRFMIAPYLSGTYSNYLSKSYNDDTLHYSRNRLDYGVCSLGIRLQKDFELFKLPTSVKASIAWIHQLSDKQAEMEVRNTATNVGAKIRGQFGENDLVKASVDIESSLNSDTSVGLGYSYLDNNQVGEHSFNVSVNFRF